MTDFNKAESARRAANARWGGRGPSALIRVDVEAADELKRVPVDVRRAVASEGVRAAAAAYLAGNRDD